MGKPEPIPAPHPGTRAPQRPATAAGAAPRGPSRLQRVHRVIQLNGRRYSLNLELPFWQTLEDMARSERIRLNRLVARIAAEAPDEANLASCVRAFCIATLRHRALRAEVRFERADLAAVIEGSPAAALAVSAGQEILAANAAFRTWLGAADVRLVGEALQRHFRFRTRQPLEDLWRSFGEGRITNVEARLISIVPGRVRAANVVLQPLRFAAPETFACVVWLKPAAQGERG